MNKQTIREVLEEWYPTFSTHWDKQSNCPCEQCADVRITKAMEALQSLILGALPEKFSKGCGWNDCITETKSKIEEIFK